VSAGRVIGWDVGGAHLKACLVERGVPRDAAQWACPLWQGVEQLQRALAEALARWPAAAGATHAVTMSGEMVDLFEHREAGVATIAGTLAAALGGPLQIYAGDAGWCSVDEAPARWRAIASANWHAGAALVAQALGDALLIDIGSTTTDLIALRAGRVVAAAADDHERLASGALVYQGVVRTPLCTLAPRVPFRGRRINVMNEWFATSADVYRLTGELDPAHDQQPSADGAPKSPAATRQRLARMIGLDARDAAEADWLALAQFWRSMQLAQIQVQAERVLSEAALAPHAPCVAAGCGDFLARELAVALGRRCLGFAALLQGDTPDAPPGLAGWLQVCAPAAAVALLQARRSG
jgi:probable H4MPT-linked C1 transfer pathway protein